MLWIKELFKLEVQAVTESAPIRRTLALATTVGLGLAYWHGVWLPAGLTSAALVFSLFFPKPMGRLLTMLKTVVAMVIHSLSLILLAVTYFLVVTPLGLAMKSSRREDSVWRQEPTEQPTVETFVRPY